MLDALFAALEPPESYAPGEPLWEDEHISGRMLMAHLDPDYEGASRGHAFIDRSASWIAATLPPGEYPRLLDLGCGPGLYAQRLCHLGYRVTGIDLSPRSIAYAQNEAAMAGDAIEYRTQNYLTLWEKECFDAVILIYCDYGALPPGDRARLMEIVHGALRPGGRFLLDAFTPEKLAAFEEVRQWQSNPRGGFWSAQPYLALQNNLRYPGRISLEQTVLLEEGGQRDFRIWHQYFTLEHLAGEAQAAGFSIEACYGDVAGAAYTGKGDTMALLLAKQG